MNLRQWPPVFNSLWYFNVCFLCLSLWPFFLSLLLFYARSFVSLLSLFFFANSVFSGIFGHLLSRHVYLLGHFVSLW